MAAAFSKIATSRWPLWTSFTAMHRPAKPAPRIATPSGASVPCAAPAIGPARFMWLEE